MPSDNTVACCSTTLSSSLPTSAPSAGTSSGTAPTTATCHAIARACSEAALQWVHRVHWLHLILPARRRRGTPAATLALLHTIVWLHHHRLVLHWHYSWHHSWHLSLHSHVSTVVHHVHRWVFNATEASTSPGSHVQRLGILSNDATAAEERTQEAHAAVLFPSTKPLVEAGARVHVVQCATWEQRHQEKAGPIFAYTRGVKCMCSTSRTAKVRVETVWAARLAGGTKLAFRLHPHGCFRGTHYLWVLASNATKVQRANQQQQGSASEI